MGKLFWASLVTLVMMSCTYYLGLKEMGEELKPVIDGYKKEVIELREQSDSLYDEIERLDGVIKDREATINTLEEQLEQPVVIERSDIKFKRSAEFLITAYSPYDDRNGINSDGDPNKTATGTKPKPGTFAVDPNVIPYGTEITILYSDGSIERGVAEDTGGAIKSNRIDVFRYSYDTAMSFGKKWAVALW